MSDTLNAAVDALKAKMDGREFDGSVKFEIEDLGSVRIEGAEVSVDDGDADCTVSADEDTFRGLMSGDVSATGAFMSGKIKIDGDMSKAMALNTILG